MELNAELRIIICIIDYSIYHMVCVFNCKMVLQTVELMCNNCNCIDKFNWDSIKCFNSNVFMMFYGNSL